MLRRILTIGLLLMVPLAAAHEDEEQASSLDRIFHKFENVFARFKQTAPAEEVVEAKIPAEEFLSPALKAKLANQEDHSAHANHMEINKQGPSRIDLHIKKKSWY